MYIIYKLTSPSKKCYIGWTSKSLKNRLSRHQDESKIRTHKMANAIKKYHLEKWKKEILFETDNKYLSLEKEKYFIKKFNSIDNGYNFLIGGNNGWLNKHHSNKTKQKMSMAKKGIPVIRSKLHKNNIIKALKLRNLNNNPVKNVEVRKKIANSLAKIYKITKPDGTTEIIKNLTQYCKENNIHKNKYLFSGTSKSCYKVERI